MIDKYGVSCDKCPACEHSDGRGFSEMIRAIKVLGWKISKIGAIWLHYCPTCAGNKSKPKPQQPQNHWWNEQ